MLPIAAETLRLKDWVWIAVKSTEIYKIIIVRNIKHDLKEPLDSRQYSLKESFLRERETETEREREIELPIPKAGGGRWGVKISSAQRGRGTNWVEE
jgi:mRNA-degrading endonuclease RelE of RelBE toxin-antitoxin system